MADEVNARVPTGNGESIELNLKDRRVGLVTKSLIPALAVIGAFAILYVVVGQLIAQLTGGQVVGHATLAQILQLLNAQHQAAMAEIQATRQHTDAQTADLRAELLGQNQQGQAQTKELVSATREQTMLLRQWFAVVLHKLQYPDTPVSLDLPLPHEKGGEHERR